MPPLPLWLSLAFAFGVAPLLAILALTAVHFVLDRLLAQRHAPVLRQVLCQGRSALAVAVGLLAVQAALPAVELPGALAAAAERLTALALVAALGWALTRKVAAVFDAYLEGNAGADENWLIRRRRTQLIVFRRLAIAAGLAITAGLVLTAIPAVRAVGLSLFASAGVAGIVAGIAARPAVSNIIAGIQLALTQPIRLGDAVLVEGEWGHVTEISSTFVTITTWDQRSLVVPLGYFMERPIRNWTKTSSQLIDTAFLYVDFTVPVEAIRAEAKRILEGTKLWDRRAFAVQVTDIRERSMEIRVLMSAANSGDMFDLRCLMREQLIGWLAREYPQGLPQERLELARPTQRRAA
ncbi:mechanosensitive ion channel family protein [Siccirubricoccus sp. KC 17139]|uniref:Mechanosensitive ion channel family protein n=1 Tax=Siccirubricoccus soli TaxID=2899147 RepID=A0ABT1D8G9_9PROT|nr:mechanosensitive ion channel domain-containing protein [Siccirubricoccus soli]MCO6418235.1 mechanosensitive ion channel family protein [Siccirubricoccus soli]MCP2684370.1 mechanosensitive ion channel family protein [Siccirubricoccus soli]